MKVSAIDSGVQKDVELKVFLEISRVVKGEIFLRAKAADGLTWNILAFDRDGKIARFTSIPEQTGWPVDAVGRLKFDTEE